MDTRPPAAPRSAPELHPSQVEDEVLKQKLVLITDISGSWDIILCMSLTCKAFSRAAWSMPRLAAPGWARCLGRGNVPLLVLILMLFIIIIIIIIIIILT